jgi:hypothetical protein
MSEAPKTSEEQPTIDFPVTRRTLKRLDEWLATLAAPLLPLKEVAPDAGLLPSMPIRFAQENEPALLVGKGCSND